MSRRVVQFGVKEKEGRGKKKEAPRTRNGMGLCAVWWGSGKAKPWLAQLRPAHPGLCEMVFPGGVIGRGPPCETARFGASQSLAGHGSGPFKIARFDVKRRLAVPV